MYARVINGVVLPGRMEELIRLIEDDLAPAVSERAGSRGMLLLTDLGSRRAISVSLWESKETMLETETNEFLNNQLAKVMPLLDEAPSTRNFRVSVST